MEPISEIELEPIEGDVPKAHVLRGTQRGRQAINGRSLEAQFKWGQEYLLLVSDGSPFEEILHFHLLAEDLQPVDELWLGRMYNAGIVKDLVPVGEDSLEFSFFGGDLWRMQVSLKPRRRLTLPLVSAVHYPVVSLKGHRLRLDRLL